MVSHERKVKIKKTSVECWCWYRIFQFGNFIWSKLQQPSPFDPKVETEYYYDIHRRQFVDKMKISHKYNENFDEELDAWKKKFPEYTVDRYLDNRARELFQDGKLRSQEEINYWISLNKRRIES